MSEIPEHLRLRTTPPASPPLPSGATSATAGQRARAEALTLAVRLHSSRDVYDGAEDISVQSVFKTAEQFREYIENGVDHE